MADQGYSLSSANQSTDDDLSSSTQYLRKKVGYRKSFYKSNKKYDLDKNESKCPFGCCKRSSIGDFLLQKGYLDGFCSDITVKAFDKEYHLHKLILSRSGYFRTLFFGSWSDCDSNYHELIFDDIDNVTAESFELAIASLYGGTNKGAEKRLAINMISTGQFLDIQETVCLATDNIISDLSFDTISKYTNFAYHQKLGLPSERILESSRALLCVDGWESGILKWDGIPVDIIIDVVGSDSFFVPTEWDRCLFIIKLIERRIKAKSTLTTKFSKLHLQKEAPKIRSVKSMYMNKNKPQHLSKARSSSFSNDMSIPIPEDTAGSSDACESNEETTCEEDEDTAEEISKLKQCLNSKVYFCHLSFEQLQLLETLKDVNGEPFVESRVLKDALWTQSSLYRIIVSCKKGDPKLNIVSVGEKSPEGSSDQWYRIPIKDETIYGAPKFLDKVISENQSIIEEDNPNETAPGKEEDDEDDFEDDSDCTKDSDNSLRNDSKPITNAFLENILKQHTQKRVASRKIYKWSKFPPFRFSIAFSDVSSLAPEKRMYGKVLWYAGCYWNLYVQKIQKHKRFQLGVYLHRASNPGPPRTGYVNADIYQNMDIVNGFNPASAPDDSNTVTIGEDDIIPNDTFESIGINPPNEDISLPELNFYSNTEDATELFGSTQATDNTDPGVNNDTIGSDGVDSSLLSYDRQKDKSLLSYEDKRHQISVYFIIRTPSRKSKSNLTCFTSSPSLFSTSQSWGWKSNSMCSFNEDGTLIPGQNKYLKFMVVLGNI